MEKTVFDHINNINTNFIVINKIHFNIYKTIMDSVINFKIESNFVCIMCSNLSPNSISIDKLLYDPNDKRLISLIKFFKKLNTKSIYYYNTAGISNNIYFYNILLKGPTYYKKLHFIYNYPGFNNEQSLINTINKTIDNIKSIKINTLIKFYNNVVIFCKYVILNNFYSLYTINGNISNYSLISDLLYESKYILLHLNKSKEIYFINVLFKDITFFSNIIKFNGGIISISNKNTNVIFEHKKIFNEYFNFIKKLSIQINLLYY